MKTQYVVGFLFNTRRDAVVLIEKNKPDWQKGLINGVGGKVESDEQPFEAMRREFREEAGLDIEDWIHFATLQGPEFEVTCYKAFTGFIRNAVSQTDEELRFEPVRHCGDPDLKGKYVSNLPWLVQMALDDNYGKPFVATVDYQ